MTYICFEETRKECIIANDGVVINTMRGSVYLTPEEVLKIAKTIIMFGNYDSREYPYNS